MDDQDMAGLPNEATKAANALMNMLTGEYYDVDMAMENGAEIIGKLRSELLRLTRENVNLRSAGTKILAANVELREAARDLNDGLPLDAEQGQALFDHMMRLARENAELRAGPPDGCELSLDEMNAVLSERDKAFADAERAEAELAALKRRIAEAPVKLPLDPDSVAWIGVQSKLTSVILCSAEFRGQRVALLPVGGEG